MFPLKVVFFGCCCNNVILLDVRCFVFVSVFCCSDVIGAYC
jgi:hypothetical protein